MKATKLTTRILFFGALKDVAGGERIVDLPAHVRDFSSLVAWISESDAELGAALDAPAIRFAVDKRMSARDEAFSNPQEIAFMSPFSGG